MEGAIAAYEASLAIKPSAIALTNLAIAYGKLGQFERAYELIEQAREQYPQHGMTYIRLGDLHAMRERDQEAFAAYELAQQLDPFTFEKHYRTVMGAQQ